MLSARDVGSIAQYVGQGTLCVRATYVMVGLAVLDYAWQLAVRKEITYEQQKSRKRAKRKKAIRTSRRVSGASCERWPVSA
jgi:hypothetical protein